jgi:hypothetical protein
VTGRDGKKLYLFHNTLTNHATHAVPLSGLNPFSQVGFKGLKPKM